MTGEKKKLIEVALPLDAINRESAREKSIRHGHPSTLHLWWARRPLAACRAVLFAQLVDDPSARPEEFPTEADQEQERQRLFGIIERLVKWENSNNETVLNEARAEILKSCDGEPPAILDPFAGGGSIPLEAQRLGLKAIASDLNPVAVLINKALIEIPPRWAGRRPVHPDQEDLGTKTWTRAQGLAEDVRHYGRWIREMAEIRIGHLYPDALIPDGPDATVIAWIWARTVRCPNPVCGAEMPLLRSFWLGKKPGKEAWLLPVVENRKVRFAIASGRSGPERDGTVARSGARCLVCDQTVGLQHVRDEAAANGLGQKLVAVVAEGHRRRVYLPATEKQEVAAAVERPGDGPDALVTSPSHDVDRLPMYGMRHWSDAFTSRQLTAMLTLSELVTEASVRVAKDAVKAGMDPPAAEEYAAAVSVYLAFAVSKTADYLCSISTWSSNPKMEAIRNAFARQAIPMTWDFAEGNPFGSSGGSFSNPIDYVCAVIERLPSSVGGVAKQMTAATALTQPAVLATDPPYYDNVGYADLSDFFYVWLRRSLRASQPSLFATLLTPKAEELVALPHRHADGKKGAQAFFQRGFVDVFSAASKSAIPGFPMTVFYAFKQSESDTSDGVASTGWETMLSGLIQSGLQITATWPMRTEMVNRMVSSGTNALASSIVLACRARGASAGVTDRRAFIAELKAELPTALRHLQQGAVAPVDMAQAAIGPGMAVFSKYAKVLESSGEPMRVRTALGLINQVLDEVLSEQEGDFDADTRWAVKWFEQFGFDEGAFGDAETLCKATGTSIDGLRQAGVLESKSGKVWLVGRDDLPEYWDPVTDDRVPVWEATQHMVKELLDHGEASSASLLARLGGVGEAARDLAYRLYAVCERKGWSKEGGAYNALVVSWPDLQRQAASAAAAEGMTGDQGTLL